ncbi:MAG: M56 family metallopeptidase [Planctomycetaceae bacterium]
MNSNGSNNSSNRPEPKDGNMYVFTSNAFESLARMAFFSAAIYGTVLLVIAFAASLLLRRAAAATRHRLWSATFLALLLLPLLSMMLPALLVPIDVEPVLQYSDAMFGPSVRKQVVRFVDDKTQSVSRPVEKSVTASLTPNSQGTPLETLRSSSSRFPGLSFAQFAALTWAFVAAILLAGIVYGARQTRCYARRSRPIIDDDVCRQFDDLCRQLKVNRPVRLLESTENVIPMTWGILHPAVLLPTEARMWSPDLRRAVLLHELFHVQRNDIAVQLLGRVVCTLYWFHPLAWVALQKLRVEREQACDDAVLCVGERASDYASRLLEIARLCSRKRPFSLAVGFIQGGKLERRVRALLDASRIHAPTKPRFVYLITTLMLALTCTMVFVRPLLLASQEVKRNRYGRPYHIIRKDGLLVHLVKMVDTAGNPIVGATVIYPSLGYESGASAMWDKDWQQTFTTDEQGVAVIKAPDVADYADDGYGGIIGLLFDVRHSDHPTTRVSDRLLDDTAPIVLEETLRVGIRAICDGADEPVTSDLFVQTSGNSFVKWSLKGGVLQSNALSATDAYAGRYLRVVYAPSGKSAWYSELIDLQDYAKDGTAHITANLFPGVRVEGQLSDNVPRPITGGRVSVVIADGPNDSRWDWQDMAEIREDGTFAFESLPRDTNLQLVALCDGWISRSTSEAEAKFYAKEYGLTIFSSPFHDVTRITPRLFRLDGEVVKPVLAMEPTATCEVIVEDEDGKPIEGADVNINPAVGWYQGGLGVLGMWKSQLTWLKNVDKMMGMSNRDFMDHWRDMRPQYIVVTDAEGRAVLHSLPQGNLYCDIYLEDYEVVPKGDEKPERYRTVVKTNADRTAKLSIMLRKRR